ncbi:DNA polymerase III subunit gamma/tau [Hyalangium rubrum]|uniref:DNA polymerase III subunit gamma/tau n=1 Tax=Hyalangium rubrum TaxID=3103134 RepID=A0ABU5H7C8_9BACT|nr:DNA polymerase III subunit gamma/tau [Hyalangium sp. s54d21]MDY7228999.1 DNA polymerase III subunit gamma/tau [Hyalangium sp. s54d21]
MAVAAPEVRNGNGNGTAPSAPPPRPWQPPRNEAPAPAARPPEPPRGPEASTPVGATPLSRVTEPAPEVRVINVRKPPEALVASADERMFPEEGSAEGCASGECLPEPPEPEPEPAVAQAPVSSGRDIPTQSNVERWRAAVEAVRIQSPRHGTALAHGRLLWLRPGEVGLAYPPTAGFHKAQVTGAGGRPGVEKALSDHFGRPTKLITQDGNAEAAAAPPSLAEQDAQARAAYTHSTEGKVRTHPSVRAVLKILGGEIEHIQVLEPERPPASPAVESPDESA